MITTDRGSDKELELRPLAADRQGRGREYWGCLGVLLLAYVCVYGWLLVSTDLFPYVMDNNESFSSLWHAYNAYHFGFDKTFGLADEAFSPDAAAHPYVHTHQGNFPRVFAFLIYVVGARNVESQILITTFTAGLAAILLTYHFFQRLTGNRFALLVCLVFITDYICFSQWQVDTYRVWHVFFVFASLMCVRAASSARRPALWAAIVFVNFAALFYFELVFVAFVTMLTFLYAAWNYRRAPRALLRFALPAIAGGATSLLVLVLQLVAYLGPTGFVQDVYFTYVARNVGSDPELLAKINQFYEAHRVAFWYNFEDSSSPRTLEAFARGLFAWDLQVYTPLFSLVCGVLLLGTLAGVARFRSAPWAAGARWEMPGARLPPLAWIALAASLYLPLMALLRDPAFTGMPSTADNMLPGTGGNTTWLAPIVALVTPVLFTRMATGSWWGFRYLASTRVVLACAAMVAIWLFMDHQGELYNQSFQPLWLGQLEDWLPYRVNQAIVAGAIGVAPALSLVGAERVLGPHVETQVRSALGYVCLAAIALGLTFALAPGYVYSGYLVRSAPLAVFVTDIIFSVAVYTLLSASGRALRRVLTIRRTTPFERLARTGFVLLSGALAAFSIGFWVHIQLAYVALLPADHFAFLKMFSAPPYTGASVVTGQYAAPVAAFTGQWAYFDPAIGAGQVSLTAEGYQVERDLATYLWLADRATNSAYLKPDYYLCANVQTFGAVVNRLVAGPGAILQCAGQGLVKQARAESQLFPRDRLVAEDPSGRSDWALVKLDWDYPPYLELLPGGSDGQLVQAGPEETRSGFVLTPHYVSRQQEGWAQLPPVIRVYRAADACALAETDTATSILLPPGFSDWIWISVTPRTATATGREYLSDRFWVGRSGPAMPEASTSGPCQTQQQP